MSLFQQTDETLIKKAISGNQRAWNKLVGRYENVVYQYALRMTSNPADAKDLMQETFVSVCRSLAEFRGDSGFKTWLLKIAHFRCIEHYRRRKFFAGEDELANIDAEPEQACPELKLVENQKMNQILSIMATLPFEQKLIVELKVFQQLTFEQIAEQLGISGNTVKSRFYKSLDKLKILLESSYDAA